MKSAVILVATACMLSACSINPSIEAAPDAGSCTTREATVIVYVEPECPTALDFDACVDFGEDLYQLYGEAKLECDQGEFQCIQCDRAAGKAQEAWYLWAATNLCELEDPWATD
jgi:hypothetical protein